MQKILGRHQNGFTVIELLVTCTVFAIIAISVLSTYVALNSSATNAKHKAVALQIATAQAEKLKSLPYDDLVVGSPTPPTGIPQNIIINGYKYDIRITIKYVDDAYDGCANYSANIEKYCRNYPPPAAVTSTDKNPADYKNINVKIYGQSGSKLAEVDSIVGARAAETGSNTGTLAVKVIDGAGNAIYDAKVELKNTNLSPAVNIVDYSDSNGQVLFYGLTPDGGNNYVVTVSKNGYSSHSTIKANGSLIPIDENPNIVVQQEAQIAIVINPIAMYSLLLQATDENDQPLPNMTISYKGGYKLYTDQANAQYSVNGVTSATDNNGYVGVQNLTPGPYIFCGDNGKIGCSVGPQNYQLLSATASIDNSNPIKVLSGTILSPPNPTFTYNAQQYFQKVILKLKEEP